MRLISLDCEMVTCEGDVKELVRVCAVGSDYDVSVHQPIFIHPSYSSLCMQHPAFDSVAFASEVLILESSGVAADLD